MKKKVVIAGDFAPIGRVNPFIKDENYLPVLGEVKDILKDVDYSVVNLECPVSGQGIKPIEKHGPNLSCSSQSLAILKWAGFKCVTLANNHFLDYGPEGARLTIQFCKVVGLDYVGGGMNLLEAAQTLYANLDGIRIAIINCCEHEFSIAEDSSAGSNPLNAMRQFYAIQEAKKNAEYVIVIVHGGVEHFWLPSPRMKETYRFFIDAGADAVINHHQHCFSGYEIYNKKPIFYGLGNFCFDWNKENEQWSIGFVVCLYLSEEGIDYELLPYRQCYKDIVGVHFMEQEGKNNFYKMIKQYNYIISDESLNKQEYLRWCNEKEKLYRFALNPLYNRYTKFIFDTALCQKLLRGRWLFTKDMIENESHVERLKLTINNMIKLEK